MNTLGPNTNAPPAVLRPSCILCGGEDRAEFLDAVRAAINAEPKLEFAYRCYEFWSHADRVFILTGIGTATLEPLLWEILKPGIIRRILLVGTAGMPAGKMSAVGTAYAIDRSYSAGTSLDFEKVAQPLIPRWPLPSGVPRAASASTDYFYGFSPRLREGTYPLRGGNLERRYDELIEKVDLIEMEVAAFYCFCERFGGAELKYLALKSPTNIIGELESQTQNSPKALAACVKAAWKLLAGNGSQSSSSSTFGF